MVKIKSEDTELLDKLIEDSGDIAVISHINPDGDAVGSTAGMYGYLTGCRKKRKVTLIYPHAWPDALGFLAADGMKRDIIIHEDMPQDAEKALLGADLIFCMDLNSFDRTGEAPAAVLRASGAKKVLIDHHLHPDRESFDLVFSETEISSTAEYLFHILMAMPDIKGDASRLPGITARACMTGMTTDTNNFANSVYPSTFSMASSLLAAGVDRDDICSHLFNEFREERLRLMGEMLYTRMKITEDGVAYMILDRKTMMKYNIRDGETEGFVNMPLSIDKVRMSIFLKEDKEKFRVSIRSKKGVSANRCAKEHFNGGGHELASGGRLLIPEHVSGAEAAAEYIETVTKAFMNKRK